MYFRKFLRLGLLVVLAGMLVIGCGAWGSVKKWTGTDTKDDLDEEMVPPESLQETVMIDGKAYVRSKNPYWMMVADQPEYLYVEKGTEFVGAQQHLINSLVKAVGIQQQKAMGKSIPPDKLQEMVRAEVDRILREQGLGGFVSQTKGSGTSVVGRAVAVIPDLDTPASAAGLNRTLGTALGEALGRTKDLRVSTPGQVDGALRQAGVADQKTISTKIKALGDALAVQGIVLTGVMPSQGGSQGAVILEVYDAFTGLKEDSLVSAAPAAGLTPETVTKYAQNSALRISGDLAKIPWFGRVEFVKEDKVYLNLGQNSGLKVGDRLKVVEPGKAVVNPKTQKVLGYTADVPQGEIKVTELLSSTAAVAQTINGGPFKPNDKVKAVK
jgi:hypothetical protein